MPVWFVTGKLGSGKTLVSIGKIHEYLKDGRKVATNLDINVDELFRKRKNLKRKFDVARVPDKPSIEDMDLLGLGYEGEKLDDKRTGLMVLDELGTWFNTRNYQQKGRKELIDWFIHARKKRWDIMLLVQNISLVDKQLIDSLCQYHVKCKRSDGLKVFGFTPPNWHTAEVFYNGVTESKKNRTEAWRYKGLRYYKAYDTEQVFTEDYPHTVHCPLRKYQFDDLPAIPSGAFNKHFTFKNVAISLMAIANFFLISKLYTDTDLLPVVAAGNVSSVQPKKYNPSVQPVALVDEKEPDVPIVSIFEPFGQIYVTGELRIDSKVQVFFNSESFGSLDKATLKRLGISAYKVSNCFYELIHDDENLKVSCAPSNTSSPSYSSNSVKI